MRSCGGLLCYQNCVSHGGIPRITTNYETVAFLIPDWLFYTFRLFGYRNPVDLTSGFYLAITDVFTKVDAAFIPLAFAVKRGATPIFRRRSVR